MKDENYYALAQITLYKTPDLNKSSKSGVVNPGDFVRFDGATQTFVHPTYGEVVMASVLYRGVSHWTYRPLIEPYLPESNNGIVVIPEVIQTADGYDAEQYINYEGRRLTNLCGEFCATHCGNLAGNEVGIVEMLRAWSTNDRKFYKLFVPTNRPTGVDALQSMVKVMGLESQTFDQGLYDPTLKRAVLSPGRFQAKLEAGWRLIAGVVIGLDGKIIPTGTLGHWVVLEDVCPVRNGDGFVTLYNPYPNRMQGYSYGEFIASMRRMGATGLWVKVK
jgi:hypothetical protein